MAAFTNIPLINGEVSIAFCACLSSDDFRYSIECPPVCDLACRSGQPVSGLPGPDRTCHLPPWVSLLLRQAASLSPVTCILSASPTVIALLCQKLMFTSVLFSWGVSLSLSSPREMRLRLDRVSAVWTDHCGRPWHFTMFSHRTRYLSPLVQISHVFLSTGSASIFVDFSLLLLSCSFPI